MTTERNPQGPTPGPWRASTAVIMDGFNPVMGPGGVIIALVSTLAGKRMDARLIAAAPELLAALENLADFCEQVFVKPRENQELQDAFAAIASATLGGEGA